MNVRDQKGRKVKNKCFPWQGYECGKVAPGHMQTILNSFHTLLRDLIVLDH